MCILFRPTKDQNDEILSHANAAEHLINTEKGHKTDEDGECDSVRINAGKHKNSNADNRSYGSFKHKINILSLRK